MASRLKIGSEEIISGNHEWISNGKWMMRADSRLHLSDRTLQGLRGQNFKRSGGKLETGSGLNLPDYESILKPFQKKELFPVTISKWSYGTEFPARLCLVKDKGIFVQERYLPILDLTSAFHSGISGEPIVIQSGEILGLVMPLSLDVPPPVFNGCL